ncbi:hypothetical protein Xaut_3621 [Xanthobacter versatilis]|uniref:DUF1376 domain-containing protein n=1 Tax=Xanthobacter autotrophicus (strain ATCC BAA-1158 / Py2) TaxID=78245 RepID=A7ILF6_XANP2|nr:hypothetical protein Xaut_3621 [Xanthobacter autotrophicus Py2]
MTDWFRSWHGAPTDPKWLGIARKAGVAPGIAVAVAWALMDRASQADDRGSIAGYDADGLACFFGCDPEQVDAIVSAMEEKGVVDGGRLSNWEKRQPKREDTSTQRVKEYRERNKVGVKRDVTQCNAPEADTEADTEVEELSPSLPSEVRPLAPTERGSFLNPDWAPSDAAMALAITELGGQAEASRTLEKFRNYWLSKSGKDGRKRDWERTWRNWVMTEMDRGGRHGKRTGSGVGNPPRGPTKSELNRAAMVEVLTGRADSRLSASASPSRWADGGPEGAGGS